MNLEDTIKKIIFLPKQFTERKNVSAYSLLEEAGYFHFASQISEHDIRKALMQQPECVSLWLQWSEDKRTIGWYFLKETKTKYAVGRFQSEKGKTQEREFSDAITACSVFIKKEIEAIRSA